MQGGMESVRERDRYGGVEMREPVAAATERLNVEAMLWCIAQVVVIVAGLSLATIACKAEDVWDLARGDRLMDSDLRIAL